MIKYKSQFAPKTLRPTENAGRKHEIELNCKNYVNLLNQVFIETIAFENNQDRNLIMILKIMLFR